MADTHRFEAEVHHGVMPNHPPSPIPPAPPIPYPNIGMSANSAPGNGWVLFFDEADALFGKRTEVRAGSDRF